MSSLLNPAYFRASSTGMATLSKKDPEAASTSSLESISYRVT
jgi:hypothetical protein